MNIILVLIVLILWLLYGWLLKVSSKGFTWHKWIFPLLILSILLNIDFAVNYVAAAVPSLNDGISAHGIWASYLISDNNWSIESFHDYFKGSSFTSVCFLVLYLLATGVDQFKNNDK